MKDGWRCFPVTESGSMVAFANLPESEKGRWGEGLTAEDLEKCVWLKPKLVAAIEYAEWTPANHLRHSRFVALREDKDARQVVHE